MSTELIAIIGIVILIILICCRVWIGAALAVVGFVGLLMMNGPRTAMGILATAPFSELDNYVLTAVPMFTVMGIIIAETSIGSKLFACANKFLGRFSGGVASATVTAAGILGAVTGSDNVSCVIMSKIAYPELKRIDCQDSLAAAAISAGGPLAILIPPSLPFIVYGMFTETSIASLFMAGIVPGIILILLFIAAIMITCKINPALCPKGPQYPIKEKMKSLVGIIPIAILMIIVLGSIYLGFATPTEAGAVGAFGAFFIALFSRDMTFKKLIRVLKDSVVSVGFVVFMLVGTYIFIKFITMSKLPFLISNFILGLDVTPAVILLMVAIMYIVLGMIMPQIPMLVLTVPILAPAMVALGFDIVWFGVFVIMMMALGGITPPIGLNVFIVGGVTKVPIGTIFKGVWPFIIADIVLIILVAIFPEIPLWLPGRM